VSTSQPVAQPPNHDVRPQILPIQKPLNRLARGLLRTPLLCRALGKRLITIYVVGRKSGRLYAVPVAYTRYDGSLLVGTPFGWARNLRSGQPVDLRLAGKRRSAEVQVIADEDGVVEHYAVMVRDNHAFARFSKIELDPTGNPRVADLHRAWANGARVIRLTPR
jgi:deazaflavin-dependent oxidoreductase (nitroreductase family)